MKQSFARSYVILALILNLISFILSLIAYHLPNWKYVQLRPTFTPIILSDNTPMDPLIRGEVDKYVDTLYHRGETHSFGLLIHCITGDECGKNYLPSFEETNYGLCHNINYHRQCIFSNRLLATSENNYDNKCACQQPFYAKIIHKLLIILIILELLFIFVNTLRLCRRHCTKHCLNDIQLRLISLLSSIFSLLFLIIIIIQYNSNRLTEPLEFFESMRRHYSRIQIYTFSKDLEIIIQQFENALDFRMGASYVSIMIILFLTFISFLTSITVEIKISTTKSSSLTLNEDEEKKNDFIQNHENQISLPTERFIPSGRLEPSDHFLPLKRFVPSDEIRFKRQTKV
ncbi:unnamed protein product [Rotaria socialis]|uniref:Uncharacterized protein n=4 Tax=Rotaria socialis TaxID=392032 RepID=A0A817TC80_9BILA|nr:unnamed protein product [Rotaria socialis]CAF3356794.1 unnamed protein product [Rotaria socialis]CAF3457616.1 unnamed protein product [Rotaria socialis]CAF3547084.1 unnamed protein product [Rotaria socialis]CAF4300770.1 unnamed protein product [Rotaria socialis]